MLVLQETPMNLLDMHTRERVNKIHIAEMHRSAHHRRLLRGATSSRISILARGKRGLVLVISFLIMLIALFLITAAISFA